MRVVEVIWTPKVNMMIIQCDCGVVFSARIDRWTTYCKCGRRASTVKLRNEFVGR